MTAPAKLDPDPKEPLSQFEMDLRKLINYHSQENGSDTPDFLLAEYLSQCLATFNVIVVAREKWYGRR